MAFYEERRYKAEQRLGDVRLELALHGDDQRDGSVTHLDHVQPPELAEICTRRQLHVMRALVALTLDTVDVAIKIKEGAEEGP